MFSPHLRQASLSLWAAGIRNEELRKLTAVPLSKMADSAALAGLRERRHW
jgi:hypothetical protein